MSNVPTPHNAAVEGEIAKTVLMPGDPKRSKFIAETFLENPKLINDIRGIQGYTGTYKGKPVTVMASGMGISSIGIYAYELYNFYDVDAIIRIGTAGSIKEDLDIGELVLADIAYTNDNFLKQLPFDKDYIPTASEDLLAKAEEVAKANNVKYRVGPVLTQNLYYSYEPEIIEKWSDRGVLAFEMEAACLYAFAKAADKKALAVLSISNNILFGSEMDPEKREKSLTDMIETALELA
ncbi:MAG: purine-nucleoside phosphorylase [Lachnospiraceae bacterium]|nr:purine-nucleoside phosphorylase [Lachnospiraceae bacterium]